MEAKKGIVEAEQTINPPSPKPADLLRKIKKGTVLKKPEDRAYPLDQDGFKYKEISQSKDMMLLKILLIKKKV